MSYVIYYLKAMKWENFVIGITLQPFYWNLSISGSDAHLWITVGPLSFDIGWGVQE